jgi:hypothetical protein
MSLADDLRQYDEAERAAILRAHDEHPEKPIEQVNREVADEFRSRWLKLIGQGSPAIGGPSDSGLRRVG